MKFKHFFLLPAMLFLATTLYSQVGIGTTDPSQAAMLEISSQTNGTGDYKGFMPPRVPNVAARDSIPASNTDDGLMVYVKDIGCIQMWTGTNWINVKCTPIPQVWPAVQNFEIIPHTFELPLASESRGYYTSGSNTGGSPNSQLYANGSRGYGVNNESSALILGPIDVSSASNPSFKLRLAGFSKNNSNNGMDWTDFVTISISTSGIDGTFSEELRIQGGEDNGSNNKWGFNATGVITTSYASSRYDVISGTGVSGGISYIEITNIPNSENLAIKIEMINNADNELWVIDDAEIWGN